MGLQTQVDRQAHMLPQYACSGKGEHAGQACSSSCGYILGCFHFKDARNDSGVWLGCLPQLS